MEIKQDGRTKVWGVGGILGRRVLSIVGVIVGVIIFGLLTATLHLLLQHLLLQNGKSLLVTLVLLGVALLMLPEGDRKAVHPVVEAIATVKG